MLKARSNFQILTFFQIVWRYFQFILYSRENIFIKIYYYFLSSAFNCLAKFSISTSCVAHEVQKRKQI